MQKEEIYRVSGRDGVLSMIPVIIGFHPADSVVLITFQPGGRRVVGPLQRVDLAVYWQDADRLAELLASTATRHGASCALVFYGLEVDPLGLGELLADYLPVNEVYFTDNTPHELHPALHAEVIAEGKVIADDRDAVRARVEFFAAAESGGADQALLFAMADAASRDGYLAENMSAAQDVLPHVLATCRRVTDPAPGASPAKVAMVANLCAVAGILAYRTGDGTLSQVCLDRARRIDPPHQLTALMTMTIELGLAPAELDGLVGGL